MCALVYERLMCVGLPGGKDEAFGEARGPRAAAAGEQAACSSPAVGSVPQLFLAPGCPSFAACGHVCSPGAVHKCELICDRPRVCVAAFWLG